MAIRAEKSEKIATVTIDCPPVNAITLDDYAAIADIFEGAKEWSEVNCIIFTGAGDRAFCAGLDLKEFVSATVEQDPGRAQIVRRCFAAVRSAPVPVIGAINGPALGAGAVLASVCDIRVASTSARFGMPEINVGRCGGGAHMMRHLPQGILRQMYFTGQPISAAEAERWGFVQKVVAPNELNAATLELATTIASKAPLGLRMAKEALNKIEFMATEDGYQLEQSYSTALMATRDAREAALAVVEKRSPVWTGA